MARIRSIKPEFFQHEALYDAERESGLPLRIAFAGLWTVADKAGRFEWRPRQLKLNVLPYDECDFSAVLSALESGGFVLRYVVDGKLYGCIPSWEKHQHINVREPSSSIPGPSSEGSAQVQAPNEAGASTGQVPSQAAGKGREGKGRGREDACMRAHATPGLDGPVFDRWLAYRSEIGKPYKPSSIEAAAEELAKHGADQAAVVQQSIANGWQGLFALKPKASGSAPKRERPPTETEIAEARKRAAAENADVARKLGLPTLAAMPP